MSAPAPTRAALPHVTTAGQPRCCIFCGGTPLTNEHIFPFWIREAVGGGGPATHLRLEGREHGPPVGEPLAYDHLREAREADVKVRAVCSSCNNGWMNVLDGDVEPLIVPMIRNRARELSEDDRLLLARWGTKIALLLEQTRSRSHLTRRRSLTPPRAYAEFFQTRLPPADATLWMFLLHPPFIGTVWRTAPVPVASRDPDAARLLGAPNGTLTTFAMGMLGFQLLHVPQTRAYRDLVQRRTWLGVPFMRVLWPPSTPLEWPPSQALEQGRFDVITHLNSSADNRRALSPAGLRRAALGAGGYSSYGRFGRTMTLPSRGKL